MIFAWSPIWLQQIWLHISDPLVLKAFPIRTLFLFVTNLAETDLDIWLHMPRLAVWILQGHQQMQNPFQHLELPSHDALA